MSSFFSKKVRVSKGSTLTFHATDFTMYLTSYSLDDVSREAIDVTHHDSPAANENQVGSREYIFSDLVDTLSIGFEGFLNPHAVPHIDDDAEPVTFALKAHKSEANALTIQGDAALIAWSASSPLEGSVTASGTIKFAGPATFTLPVASE